jgi:hypothetical protein
MTKPQKTIVFACSILAFIGFGLWLYFDRSFEPAIGIIVSLGGFASLGYPQAKKKYKKERLKGKVTFDYSNNNGSYFIGKDEMLFETSWSKASDTSIHLYKDPPSIQGVAIAQNKARIKDIKDATEFDMSSRARTINESEIAILKNNYGNYAAIRIIDIKDNSRNDDRDELNFEYVINPKGLTDFS